jgi:hypothetical protein
LIRAGIDTKRKRGKAFGIRSALGHNPKPKY